MTLLFGVRLEEEEEEVVEVVELEEEIVGVVEVSVDGEGAKARARRAI